MNCHGINPLLRSNKKSHKKKMLKREYYKDYKHAQMNKEECLQKEIVKKECWEECK